MLEGKAEPDNAKCVDIATKAALNKMLLPGAIAIGSPVAIGFILGPVVLGGMLAGALLGCVLMALMMANAGGAWDNAKKFVEKRLGAIVLFFTFLMIIIFYLLGKIWKSIF